MKGLINMKAYKNLTKAELEQLQSELAKAFEDACGKGLKLNMARGKPTTAQLDMGMGLMDALNSKSDMYSESGDDCRNYGVLTGIPEAKKLMADMMGVSADNVIVCGNASLTIMYDTVSRAYTHGLLGNTPWCKLDKVTFLCPVPGYDRHFAITQHFGIDMIPIPMDENGPDMDMVRSYVEKDPSVKGIWCVPKYSNPTGITYSDEVVRAFASLNPAAPDFRIFWDNAYVIHDLYEDRKDELLEIFGELEKTGKQDMVFEFCSTSKVSLAGAGIAAIAASKANLEDMKKSMTIQTIGYDKVNQLRHVRYFKDIYGLKEQMKRHAAYMAPKFDAVIECFDRELDGLEIGSYTRPKGGYFISFNAMEGCAKAIVAKCKEAGITLTGAGATYPYGNDPMDSNIRIAPSYPTPEEMALAADVFVLCVKLVTVEKLLAAK